MTEYPERTTNSPLIEKETTRDSNRRSRSPPNEKRHRRNHHASGFRWKDKRQNERRNHRDTNDDHRRTEHSYRDRSPTRRGRGQLRESENKTSDGTASREVDKYGVADKFGLSSSTGRTSSRKEVNDQETPIRSNPGAKASTSKLSTTMSDGEPMIIVYVNDRLGTRAAIPCLASDSIRLFKAQVAARIGRQPHEIMLKRQGERPFKNQLTLEDYGVSNGVQLDLEIDTGD